MKRQALLLFLAATLLFSCEANYSANQSALQTQHLNAAIDQAYQNLKSGIVNRGQSYQGMEILKEAQRMLKLYNQIESSEDVAQIKSLSLEIWDQAIASDYAKKTDKVQLDQYLKILNRNSVDEFKTGLQIMVLEQLHALTKQEIELYALFDIVQAIAIPDENTIKQGEDYYVEVGMEASISTLLPIVSMKHENDIDFTRMKMHSGPGRAYVTIPKPTVGKHTLVFRLTFPSHGREITRELTHDFWVEK